MELDNYLTQVRNYLVETDEYVRVNGNNLRRDQDLQIRKEFQYLHEKSSICRLNRNIKLNDYDIENLHTLLTEQYYNPALLNLVSCMVDYIVLVPDYNESLDKQMRIRNLITDLRLIGAGSYGRAFEAGLLHGNEDFIIKVPKEKPFELVHEYFVGRFLNNLRESIPNFVYTYAGFICSPPFSKDFLPGFQGSQPVNWCARKPGVQYLVQEKIPGEVMDDVIENMPVKTFMELLLQLVFSLNIANRFYSFTHYDLHIGNIILRDNGLPFSIPYSTPDKEVYIMSRYVATIIDYGFAFIRVDVGNDFENFGAYFNENFGITLKPFPLYDIFTLLTDCYYNSPNLKRIIGIMLVEFFNIRNLEPLFRKPPRGNIFLPPIKPWIDLNYWDFAQFLQRRFPDIYNDIVTDIPQAGNLRCKNKDHESDWESDCSNDQELINEIGLNPETNKIENVLDFYELFRKYPVDINYWRARFDFREGYQQLKNMFDTNALLYKNLTTNRPEPVYLVGLSVRGLYNENMWPHYLNYLHYLAQMTEILDNLQLIRDIYNALYKGVSLKDFPEFSLAGLPEAQRVHQIELSDTTRQFDYVDRFIHSENYIENINFMNFYYLLRDFNYQAGSP